MIHTGRVVTKVDYQASSNLRALLFWNLRHYMHANKFIDHLMKNELNTHILIDQEVYILHLLDDIIPSKDEIHNYKLKYSNNTDIYYSLFMVCKDIYNLFHGPSNQSIIYSTKPKMYAIDKLPNHEQLMKTFVRICQTCKQIVEKHAGIGLFMN